MTEREVLSRMDLSGMGPCVEAIGELLESLGFHDVAREMRLRWDAFDEYDDGSPP